MKELILIILALDVITEIFYIRRLTKDFEKILKETKREYEKQAEILLNNSAELRAKIVDLENNIELLGNNLSDENKELISDYQSQN